MDKRLLTLGKYNIEKVTDRDLDGILQSECYFDWIELKKIDNTQNLDMSNLIFGHEIMEKSIAEPEKVQMHAQESMILVSDSDRGFLLNPKCVYISMINIPMWKETIFENEEEYVSIRERIFTDISERAGNSCKLFHTFDHCDLILIADGEKITFSEYMRILRDIRKYSINVGSKTTIKTILDITTIYGYTKAYTVNSSREGELLYLNLEINFKTPEYTIESFQKEVIQIPDLTIETIGRYDALMLWKDASWPVFDSIVDVLRQNHSRLYTYRIIIGENQVFNDSGKSEEKHLINPKNLISTLPQYADRTFKKIYSSIKDELGKPLDNALIEIQNSIVTMLHSGFAQYYTLSFYESFYSFLQVIKRLYERIKAEAQDSDKRKRAYETVYDLFRLYFGYLNALNACTIHSERQFLQTDSYQLLYFDASPKLITFYTALANKIVSVVEKNTKNNYTFLITPDFKEHIFVESLTNDRTVRNERNILIIHANENSLYDLSSTVKIITHEIFHHIGQKPVMRRFRAKLFLKSSLAFILVQTVSHDIFMLHDKSISDYQFFCLFVDRFYQGFFYDIDLEDSTERFFRLVNLKEMNLGYDAEQETHYLSNLSRSFLSEMMLHFTDKSYKNIVDIFSDIITEPLGSCIQLFGSEIEFSCYSEIEKKIITEFSNEYLAKQVFSNIYNWLMYNTSAEVFDNINHTFRESFADLNMIDLICGEIDGIAEWYISMMKENHGDENMEEYPRIYAVLKTIGAGSCSWVKKFEEICFIKRTTDRIDWLSSDAETGDTSERHLFENYGMYYYYLSEKASEYLQYFKKNNDNSEEMDNLKKSLSGMISSFSKGTVQDIVNMMDREIFEYRQRMISSQRHDRKSGE